MAQEGEGTVYVEQRQQDCGASATEEGARALRQTAHTQTHTPGGYFPLPGTVTTLQLTKLTSRYKHNVKRLNVKPA